MKKFAGALAVALLVAALFSASALGMVQNTQISGEVEFAVWGNAASDDIHRQVIAAFEAIYPNIKVNLRNIAGNYQEQLLTTIAADVAPDIAIVDFYDAASFIEAGLAVDVTEWAERDGVVSALEAAYHPAALGELYYKGRLYSAANVLSNPDALYYNKDLFNQAGLPYPSSSWTLEDMKEAAIRLTRRGPDGNVNQWGIEFHRFFIWDIVRMNGGQLLSDDGTYVPFDQPEAYEALQWLADIDLVHDAIAWNPYEFSGAFNQGVAGMHIMWTNLTYGLRGSVTWDWDIAPIPAGKLGSIGTFKGNPVFIPVNAKNKEAAWEFMKFLGSEEAQYIYGSLGRFTPMHRTALARTIRDTEGMPPANFAQLLTWNFLPLPFVAGFRQVQDMWHGELEQVWYGNTPARVAGERIRDLSVGILAEAQGRQ